MTNPIRIAATAVACIAATSLGTTSTAADTAKTQNRDQRPCVSGVEADLAGVFAGRTVLEARWEVRGLGQNVANPDDLPMGSVDVVPRGAHVILYPSCGYSADEGGVVVYYDARRHWYHIFRWVMAGSTLHGHDRAAG